MVQRYSFLPEESIWTGASCRPEDIGLNLLTVRDVVRMGNVYGLTVPPASKPEDRKWVAATFPTSIPTEPNVTTERDVVPMNKAYELTKSAAN